MNGYDLLRLTHVLGGFLGLLAFALPLIATKGGKIHRRAGWIFTGGMTLASVTGLVITVLWLAAPLAFKPHSDGELAAHLARVKTGAFFLGAISLLTLEALWQGLRALSRKRAPDRTPNAVDIGLPVALLAAGLWVGMHGLSTRQWLLVAFAAIEIGTALGDLRFVMRPLSSKMAWWYQHMNGMMVAVIGAITAFLVVGVRTMLVVPDAYAFVPWLLPSAIIVPSFMLWIRHYKVRFGEAASTKQAGGDKVAV